MARALLPPQTVMFGSHELECTHDRSMRGRQTLMLAPGYLR